MQQINENLRKMKKEMNKAVDSYASFPKPFSDYFDLHYEQADIADTETGKEISGMKKIFISYSEKESVVENQRRICGYFAIVTSKKMTAIEALLLYKSRDVSEKRFGSDKSYLGDKSMRVYAAESTETGIFIEFIALIIRESIYAKLHAFELKQVSKHDYMSVPAVIGELEKIIMIYLPDNTYHLSHTITKTQKRILSVFDINEEDLLNGANTISKILG